MSNSGWYGDTCIMACASRYVGNSGSHCGLRDVGHGVWVTICGYVTVRYGALRCVTLRYAEALRRCVTVVRYGSLRCVTVRYANALRRCVTVRYGCALRCVMVRYGGMLRFVTVRYGALRWCTSVSKFSTVHTHNSVHLAHLTHQFLGQHPPST